MSYNRYIHKASLYTASHSAGWQHVCKQEYQMYWS